MMKFKKFFQGLTEFWVEELAKGMPIFQKDYLIWAENRFPRKSKLMIDKELLDDKKCYRIFVREIVWPKIEGEIQRSDQINSIIKFNISVFIQISDEEEVGFSSYVLDTMRKNCFRRLATSIRRRKNEKGAADTTKLLDGEIICLIEEFCCRIEEIRTKMTDFLVQQSFK